VRREFVVRAEVRVSLETDEWCGQGPTELIRELKGVLRDGSVYLDDFDVRAVAHELMYGNQNAPE